MKILVTLFFSLAPYRVDLIIKIMAQIAPMNMKPSLMMFMEGSGQYEHSYSPVRENPT